jgi:hypothetical protein
VVGRPSLPHRATIGFLSAEPNRRGAATWHDNSGLRKKNSWQLPPRHARLLLNLKALQKILKLPTIDPSRSSAATPSNATLPEITIAQQCFSALRAGLWRCRRRSTRRLRGGPRLENRRWAKDWRVLSAGSHLAGSPGPSLPGVVEPSNAGSFLHQTTAQEQPAPGPRPRAGARTEGRVGLYWLGEDETPGTPGVECHTLRLLSASISVTWLDQLIVFYFFSTWFVLKSVLDGVNLFYIFCLPSKIQYCETLCPVV